MSASNCLPYKTSRPIEHVSQFLEVYGGWAMSDFRGSTPCLRGCASVLAEQALWKWIGSVLRRSYSSLAALLRRPPRQPPGTRGASVGSSVSIET